MHQTLPGDSVTLIYFNTNLSSFETDGGVAFTILRKGKAVKTFLRIRMQWKVGEMVKLFRLPFDIPCKKLNWSLKHLLHWVSFISYLAVPRPDLSRWERSGLTHTMLITALYLNRPKINESLIRRLLLKSWPNAIMESEPRTFRSRVYALSHCAIFVPGKNFFYV